MSTNVGTHVYKAPEFFQRDKDGKLKYYRSADTFAAGVTFLAMLQTTETQKLTIPHIETLQDDSESHAFSIGQLIAERIKYKKGNLNVVIIDKVKAHSSVELRVSIKLKKIIQKMTAARSETRISPTNVAMSLLTAEGLLVEANIRKDRFLQMTTKTPSKEVKQIVETPRSKVEGKTQVTQKLAIPDLKDQTDLPEKKASLPHSKQDGSNTVLEIPSVPDKVVNSLLEEDLPIRRNLGNQQKQLLIRHPLKSSNSPPPLSDPLNSSLSKNDRPK